MLVICIPSKGSSFTKKPNGIQDVHSFPQTHLDPEVET